MASSVLGFIGLGRMGLPMMTNLVKARHTLCVFDVSASARAAAQAQGAHIAASARAVADQADTVFLSLTTPSVVESVIAEISEGSAVRCVVDLSTIGTRCARRCAELLNQHHIAWIEAPVSGGITGAAAATLTVMLACPPAERANVEPLLGALGKVFYAGDAPGLAQAAKLANNMLSAAALVASSEAIAMARIPLLNYS